MSAFFLVVACPLGIVAAAWSAAAAMRLREPDGHALQRHVECTRCGGSDSLAGTLLRLGGGRCRRCGSTPPTWVLRAQAVGAAIPAAALYVSVEPAQAAILTLSGWVLLAIWITDEVSLWIPHAFWGTGLAVGLGSQAHAGGLGAAGWRAIEALVLVAVLAGGAAVARRVTLMPPLGPGDFGVIAFLGTALGYDATLDVLVITGLLGLGLVALRAAPPRARPRAFTLAIAAVLATLLLGIPGAVAGTLALAAVVRRGRRRPRAAALPFGALLAASALILMTWTAPLGRPGAAAESMAADGPHPPFRRAMTTTRLLVAALMVAAAARPCTAQQAPALGTASALGDAAVSEARRADALLWNPAAIGIYDGPISSYRLLSVDVGAAPAQSWSGPARRLGLSGLPQQLGWVADVRAGTGAAVAQGQVEWLATQVRGLAVSIGSGYLSAGDIPQPLRASLGEEDSIGSPAAPDSTLRVTATTLAVGRGIYAGVLPVAGRVWLGATAKGWLVHSYARGAFTTAEPGADVYREALLENIPGYGLDVGLIAQPVPRLRFGASVTNVVSGSWRPKRGPRVRTVSITEGADGDAEVTATTSPYLGAEDDGSEEFRAGLALWRSSSFPAVLRAGASVETNSGTFSAATSTGLTDGGLDPRWDATPVTLAFAGSGRVPLRASYGWGSDTKRLSLGLRLGGCRRQWNASVTRRTGPWGSALGAGVSLTTGSAAGCNLFRN